MQILGKISKKIKTSKFFIPYRLAFRRIGENKTAALAEQFWKNKRNDEHPFGKDLYEHILKDIDLDNINKVLEFGASFGQNLSYYAINNVDELVGIDINQLVKKRESEWPNYSGIVGNQQKLKDYSDNYFDVAFTLSVLDHIASRKEVKLVIEQMVRISKNTYILEPYIVNIEGDVSGLTRAEVKPDLPFPEKCFYEHSYLWDYSKICKELELEATFVANPMHDHSLGPFYCYIKISASAKN